MQTENTRVATKAMALAAQASDLGHTESAHSNLTNSDALHDTRKALALDLTRAGTDNSGNVEFQTAPTTEHATLDSLSHSGSVVTDASLALSNAPLTPSHMTSKMLKSPAPTLSMNKATWGLEATRMVVQHYGKHYKMTQLIWAESLLKQKLAGYRLTSATVTVRKSNISWDLVAIAIYQRTKEVYSADQCRQKWKTMYRCYREVIDNKKSIEKAQFFHEIDSFMDLDKLIHKYPSLSIIKEVVTEPPLLGSSQSGNPDPDPESDHDHEHDHDHSHSHSHSRSHSHERVPSSVSLTSSLASSMTELPTVASVVDEEARVPSHDAVEASSSVKRHKRTPRRRSTSNSFKLETKPTFLISSPSPSRASPTKGRHGSIDSTDLHAHAEDSSETRPTHALAEQDVYELPFSTMAPIKMSNFAFKSKPYDSSHGSSTGTEKHSTNDDSRHSLSKELPPHRVSIAPNLTQTPSSLPPSHSNPWFQSHPYPMMRSSMYHPNPNPSPGAHSHSHSSSPHSFTSSLAGPSPSSHATMNEKRPILPYASHSPCTALPSSMAMSASASTSMTHATFPGPFPSSTSSVSAMIDPIQSLLYYYHSQTSSRLDMLQSTLRHQSELIQQLRSCLPHCGQQQSEHETAPAAAATMATVAPTNDHGGK